MDLLADWAVRRERDCYKDNKDKGDLERPEESGATKRIDKEREVKSVKDKKSKEGNQRDLETALIIISVKPGNRDIIRFIVSLKTIL